MKYKYKVSEAKQFNKHGIDLTIYPTDVATAKMVRVDVVEGHFQEFSDKESTYIYYIIEGGGTFVLNDERVEASATDMIVIPPKTRIYYFGKMKMVLTVTPPFKEENEIHHRFVEKNESPYQGL